MLKVPSLERQSSPNQPCYHGTLGSGLLSLLQGSHGAAWPPFQGRYHSRDAGPKAPVLPLSTPRFTTLYVLMELTIHTAFSGRYEQRVDNGLLGSVTARHRCLLER